MCPILPLWYESCKPLSYKIGLYVVSSPQADPWQTGWPQMQTLDRRRLPSSNVFTIRTAPTLLASNAFTIVHSSGPCPWTKNTTKWRFLVSFETKAIFRHISRPVRSFFLQKHSLLFTTSLPLSERIKTFTRQREICSLLKGKTFCTISWKYISSKLKGLLGLLPLSRVKIEWQRKKRRPWRKSN